MIIVCAVDDKFGLTFNHRRQSQDRKMREHLLNMVAPDCLYMNSYSEELFGAQSNIVVSETFLQEAGAEDYCFVENVDILPYLNEISELILYNWNRSYPSDFQFPTQILEQFEKLDHSFEFEGSSHEVITVCKYIKKQV